MIVKQDEATSFKKDVGVKFGQHIVQLRKSYNLSFAELARRSDLTAANMSRVEKGGSNPTLMTLIKIANAFCISLEGLMKGFNFGKYWPL